MTKSDKGLFAFCNNCAMVFETHQRMAVSKLAVCPKCTSSTQAVDSDLYRLEEKRKKLSMCCYCNYIWFMKEPKKKQQRICPRCKKTIKFDQAREFLKSFRKQDKRAFERQLKAILPKAFENIKYRHDHNMPAWEHFLRKRKERWEKRIQNMESKVIRRPE